MPRPPFPHHTVTHQHPPYLPHSVIIVPTLKYSSFLQCIFEFSVKKNRESDLQKTLLPMLFILEFCTVGPHTLKYVKTSFDLNNISILWKNKKYTYNRNMFFWEEVIKIKMFLLANLLYVPGNYHFPLPVGNLFWKVDALTKNTTLEDSQVSSKAILPTCFIMFLHFVIVQNQRKSQNG